MKKGLIILLTALLLALSIGTLSSCNAVEFKISFIVDGEVYDSITTGGGEIISMPENPTKVGYTFEGWYWDRDTWQRPFTANSLLDAPLSSDMSIYAKFEDNNAVKGTDVKLDGFEKLVNDSLGTVYYISVPNSKIVLSLNELVTVSSKSKWTVSTDLSGNDKIASKTVELSVGSNIFYLLVEDEFSNVQQYILSIRRKPVYTVVYYKNALEVHSRDYVEEGCLATPPTIKLPTGYHLSRWSYDFSNPITSDVEAHVIIAPNEYTVAYDGNGGAVSTATQTVKFGEEVSLAYTERSGYTFLGWYNGNEKVVSGKWEIADDVRLVAKWRANTYTITYYNVSGATAGISNPTTYTTGSSVRLYAPQKTGYTFLGWTYSGVTEPVLNVSISAGEYGNRAFTANWRANSYTVSFNANGGECSITEKRVTYDDYVALPTPEREGYRFLGWYEETAKFTSSYWKTTRNVNLVAKWELIPYTVTYYLAGGTNATGNPASYNAATESFSLFAPSRVGYEFTGWTFDGQTTPTKNVTVAKGSKGNRVFYANWDAKSFTVGLDANGGECAQTSIGVTYDDIYTLPVPTRRGYTFLGWYYGESKYESGTCKISDNITLVAQWSIINYSISYTLNGGTNATGNPTTYTVVSGATVKNPTRTGYTFLGWTYAGASTPTKDVKITEGTIGSLTLTAHWDANTYTVYLNSNGGTCSQDSVSVKYNASYSLPTPERTGYTFAGWFSGSTQYSSGTWSKAGNLTVSAKWTARTYTLTYSNTKNSDVNVTYNYNYTGATPTTVTLSSGQALSYPSNPTRSGYIFTGWYTDAQCSSKYTFNGTISEDMTLYAGWGNVTLTNSSSYPWSISNGVLTSTNKSHSSSSTYKITAPMPVKVSFSYKTSSESGYDYLYIKKNGTTLKSCSGSTSYVSYSVDLDAGDYLTFVYSKDTYTSSYSDCAYISGLTYTSRVSYTSTAKAHSQQGFVYAPGSAVTQTVTFDAPYTLENISRVGYTFLGWYDGDDRYVNGNWTNTENVTLTPKWQANSYTVTYNANGGTASHTSDTATYDASFTLATAQRVGYTFAGWYNGTVLYSNGTWQVADDVTLVAKWQIINYPVKYNLCNGTNSELNPSTYTVIDQFSLGEPVRTGYTFLGWTFDGQDTPAKNVSVSVGTIGELLFTANWKANSYEVTLNPKGGVLEQKTITVTYDAAYELPIPTWEGREFSGWYSSAGKTENGTWKTTSDVSLTARWDMWDGTKAAGFAGGNGTATNPYKIANGQQLAYLAYRINLGLDNSLYYELTCDIDLGDMEWDPIGCYYNGTTSYSERTFKGNFNGNGHTVSNFKITKSVHSSTNSYLGLFGYIYTGALVENLGVENFIIDFTTSSDNTIIVNAGGLAGSINGTVNRCYAIGKIGVTVYGYGRINAGGLTGSIGNNSTIVECYAIGNIDLYLKDGTIHAGGITGRDPYISASEKIVRCLTTVNIQAHQPSDGYTYVGTINSEGGSNNSYYYSGQKISADTTPRIVGSSCTTEQLNSSSFYISTLRWNTSYWSFDSLNYDQQLYPKLKIQN